MNREKLQAHAHRIEAWTTPAGIERTAALNGNQKPDGTRNREATATTHRDGEHKMQHRQETRETDGLNSTDPMYEARLKRTNRMAHRQAKPEQPKGKDVGYGHGHTVFAERLD